MEKEDIMPNDWIESQMEAERRWLAPGVRSHRWEKRPPVNGGVLKDRAWRSHHIFVCECVYVRHAVSHIHTQTHELVQEKYWADPHVQSSCCCLKDKRSQSLFSITTRETRTLVCSTVLVNSVHISTIHIQMEKMKKKLSFPFYAVLFPKYPI